MIKPEQHLGKLVVLLTALAVLVVLVAAGKAEANYLQAPTAREYLWGWYGHDADVQTKRAAIERERDVEIASTVLIEPGFHLYNSDHMVRAGWRFYRQCSPGCGRDDFGSTADFYDRYFDASLGHGTGLVTDGPV